MNSTKPSMMHGSTSPNYAMIASLDVASQMMSQDGLQMSEDNILAAVELRQKVQNIFKKYAEHQDWFFRLWQPSKVEINGTHVDFEKAEPRDLVDHQSAWILNKTYNWHGFEDIEEDFIMLDPIKLTFVTPGVRMDGTYEEQGIPAGIVTDYLIQKGIVVEKTDTYSFLMLHSFGTTKGKQGELLAELLNFKHDYERNIPIKDIFPYLLDYDKRYQDMRLKDLCNEMHHFFKQTNFLETMHMAFEKLPKQEMEPAKAYELLVQNKSEYLYLDQMIGRIPAVMIVPYPPGIPVMMGGELLDQDSIAIYHYLKTLESFENRFKGYEKDIHGVERDEVDGVIYYKILCLKQQ